MPVRAGCVNAGGPTGFWAEQDRMDWNDTMYGKWCQNRSANTIGDNNCRQDGQDGQDGHDLIVNRCRRRGSVERLLLFLSLVLFMVGSYRWFLCCSIDSCFGMSLVGLQVATASWSIPPILSILAILSCCFGDRPGHDVRSSGESSGDCRGGCVRQELSSSYETRLNDELQSGTR